jgi:CRP-like cAMP-binding protein
MNNEVNNEVQQADPEMIKHLVPIDSLGPEGLKQISQNMSVRELPKGQVIFKRGDTDKQVVYLISGKVELESDARKSVVEAGSEQARHALSNLKPRQFTAKAVSAKVVIAHLNSELLDRCMAWDQMAGSSAAGGATEGYEVTEFSGEVDAEWMFQMLQTNAFMRLPTSNIDTLFSKFEEVHAKSGDVVVKQGDPGDFYYIIKHGSCEVTRKSDEGSDEVVLAELSDGNAFGEESLISSKPRNATVTMKTDGVLMRLAEADFNQLLEEPLLNWVTDQQAAAMSKEGAVLLDVRLESEFKNGSVKNAQNMPLYLLRLKSRQLDKGRQYITICDTGGRSSAAAFLLSERGFNVYVLKGGLSSLMKGSGGKK